MTAANRRLGEELGVSSDLTFGFFARYRTELDNGMHENEFVYVYFGELEFGAAARILTRLSMSTLLPFEEISRRIERDPDSFTVWLRHYFAIMAPRSRGWRSRHPAVVTETLDECAKREMRS